MITKNFRGMDCPINIGITLFWGETFNSFWCNGAGQNMLFLAQTLKNVPGVNEVYFLYFDNTLEAMSDDIRNTLDIFGFQVHELKDVAYKTDVVIEGTSAMSAAYVDMVHSHHHKVVTYRMGNDFILDIEKFIYDMGSGRGIQAGDWDGVWVIPQHIHSNQHYIEIMYKLKVRECPHVWDPWFFERELESHKDKSYNKGFFYEPGKRKAAKGWNISVHEPNISLLKTCYTPILIAEEVYRRRKEDIGHVFLTNTYPKRELPSFATFISNLSLVQDGLMSVEGRFTTPYFLCACSDIILSNQWENGLNYIYYEFLYGNYPFVHNSTFLRDANVGFYYEGFDAYDGARALIEAMDTYDRDFEDHKKRNQALLDSVSPKNERVIAAYEELLYDLLNNNQHTEI